MIVDLTLGRSSWTEILNVCVEGRHVTVKLLLLIYGRLDGKAMRVGKPISSSARCQTFYSSLHKVHEHSIANCLSIISSALVVQVVQRATVWSNGR